MYGRYDEFVAEHTTITLPAPARTLGAGVGGKYGHSNVDVMLVPSMIADVSSRGVLHVTPGIV